MAEDVSIIILTYDRPDALRSTISFLQSGSLRLPIIVADGSSGKAAAMNAETCRHAGANVTYLHRASSEGPGSTSVGEYAGILAHYFERYEEALERVATPYVVVSGDDDRLIVSSALKAVAFLEEHSDYIACQGTYLAFRNIGSAFHIEAVSYDGHSIDGEETGSRLLQILARYESPYYGVYRTVVQREIVTQVTRINIPLFFEVYHSCATAVRGKIKRLQDIYYLRNIGNPPHARPSEGWFEWAANNLDELCVRYAEHRERMVDLLTRWSDMGADRPRLRRITDMSFIFYIAREFRPELWIPQCVTTAIASDTEQDRIRAWLHEAVRKVGSSSVQAPLLNRLVLRAKRALRFALGETGTAFARRALTRLRAHGQRHDAAALPELVHVAPSLLVVPSVYSRFSSQEWAALRLGPAAELIDGRAG